MDGITFRKGKAKVNVTASAYTGRKPKFESAKHIAELVAAACDAFPSHGFQRGPPPFVGSNSLRPTGVRNTCLVEGGKMKVWVEMIKRWFVIFVFVGLFDQRARPG